MKLKPLLGYLSSLKSKNRTLKIMKVTLSLAFVCVFQLLAATGKAQNTLIELPSRSVSVETLFSQIEEQTGYLMVYSNSEIDVKAEVTFSSKKGKVGELLDELLRGTDLKYEFTNNYIVFSKSTEKDRIADVRQMRKRVTGKVIDNNGDAVIGASVLEKGTSNGTITDYEGNFVLEVKDNATLVISFVGYKTQTLAVGNRNSVQVLMQEDTEALEEVVVVGYAVQKKANLSGSVATADTKKLVDRPISNVGSALQGAVANLNIDPISGDPNDLPSFNIRGFTSINGGSPMVVIDGVISDMLELNRLNPTDIENISVLKDASSAAIYGSRAAYGVILVTTKTGKTEKVTVNYNGNIDFRGLTVTPEVVSDPEIFFHDKNQAETGSPNQGGYSPAMFDALAAWKADKTKPGYWYNPDWDEYIYFTFWDPVKSYIKNDAFTQNHNISLSGKTDKVNYYLSGNYQNQEGMIKYGRNDYAQYNTRAKLDIQITPSWKIGSNTSLISAEYKTTSRYLDKHDDNRKNKWGYGTIIESLLSLVPFVPSPLEDENGYVYDWVTDAGYLDRGGNAKKHDTTINQQFTTRVDFIKDVLFVNGQYNFSLQKVTTDKTYLPFVGSGGLDSGTWVNQEVSSANSTNARVRHITWDVYGTFHKRFAEKHDLTAIVGFNQESYRYNTQFGGRDHLITNSVPSYNLAYGTSTVDESTITWALRGLYGRVGYIYNDKYIAEFNFRRDMTSRFPHASRTVFNPSGSIAWVLSQEKFFKPLKTVFDHFKIRASYGRLGNQDVSYLNEYGKRVESVYPYIPSMGADIKRNINLGGSYPMYVTTPGLVSGRLTWEKVTTVDIGLDLTMLNNRLTFTGDLYRRDTKDMLTSQGRDLPSVLGTAVPQENAADLKTIGWDITVGWRDQFKLSGKPFNYNVDVTLSDSWAQITKVANSTGSLNSYYKGQELGEIWGLKTLGLFATDEEAKNWADQSELLYQPGKYPQAAGTIKWEDRDGDGKISRGKWTLDDHGDFYKIGNTSIRYRFGITLGASWNNFDLSAFFQGVLKHQYYPQWYDRFFWGLYSINWYNEPMSNYTDRWTEENRDTGKFFPKLCQGNAHSDTKELGSPQTRYLQDASYIRLKNLQIGYTLPQSILGKRSFQRIRIYYSGENLFCLSGLYDGYKADPENLGWQNYPLQRHHSFGVNVTF